MPMHLIGDTQKRRDALVTIEAELPGFVLSAGLHINVPGNNEPGTAARQVGIEPYQLVSRFAVRRRHGFGRGRANEAVLDYQVTDFAGAHERVRLAGCIR